MNFDQAPMLVIWEATQACDLACVHCRASAQSERNPKELTTEQGYRLLDQIKSVLEQAGMTMDDLVYVQVACTDLSLFDKFNGVYKTYFTTKDLPAREFIGAASLLRGGHFELQAIAVRR